MEVIELENHEKQLKKAWELINKVIADYKWFKNSAKDKARSIIKERVEKELDIKLKDKDITVLEVDIQKYLSIPDTKRKFLVYMVDNILSAIGDMSMTRFNAMNDLEEEYLKKYIQSPALGKTLFLKEYNKLHVPYDKLKNKCFDLLSKLDPDAKIVDKLE
jgi:hypothetical protein